MFGFVFKQARAEIETSISEVVDRAIIAVPYLVAAGFLTTALAAWLIRTYGLEVGALTVGVLFILVGLVLNAVMSVKREDRVEQPTGDTPASGAQDEAAADAMWSETERDLVKAAVAASAPHALPVLMRLIVRNLPLILGALAAVFVLTRPSNEPQQADFQPTPAE